MALVVVVLSVSAVFAPGVGAEEGDENAADREAPILSDRVLLELATDPTASPSGAVVRIEVHGTDHDRLSELIEARGGVPYGAVPGYFVEASVPVDALADLAAEPDVVRVSRTTRTSSSFEPPDGAASLQRDGILQTIIEESLLLEAWHQAGYRGAGQRIGILDVFGREELEDALAEGRVPSPAGTFCLDHGRTCSITDFESAPHGVGVAELAHRAAPEAELYLATVHSIGDLSAAVDWFAANGVSIVNRSETSEFDGPGDGTGPVGSIIDRAVAANMVFVSAAGNAGGEPGRRGQNWVGTFNDTDGDGVHNWASGDELMEFECGFLLGMRWDDWSDTTVATDYDLWIFDRPGDIDPETRANDIQATVVDPPLEHVETICDFPGDLDYMAIVKFEDAQPDGDDKIQILGNFTPMEEWTNVHSATGPGAASANPGAVTVGATLRPTSFAVAGYSSQGPTLDGRINPDLIAPSCFPVQNFPGCFSGTSSSAPFVAGVLAVLRGAGVFDDATEVDSLIPLITIDQGPPGPDNAYGHGALRIPPPASFGLDEGLCLGFAPTIRGTDGDDVLTGTDGNDVILGGGGNDFIAGGAGADVICGNEGRDVIRAGAGRDLIDGGDNRDRIWGEAGFDTIIGGAGLDRIVGNLGDDNIIGLGNRDRIKGGPGDDVIRGGAGDDTLEGGPGADDIFGGNGTDACHGHSPLRPFDAGDTVRRCEA